MITFMAQFIANMELYRELLDSNLLAIEVDIHHTTSDAVKLTQNMVGPSALVI